MELKLGLISDTHGLYRPALEDAFRGVDAILHAGDVGSRDVLMQLKRLAPVRAVSGNVDVSVEGLNLPTIECHACGDGSILITHYVGEPDYHLPPVAKAIERIQPLAVVSGHTHRPDLREHEGRLYINPGSAGPRRFNLPVACGLLKVTIHRGSFCMDARIIDLEAGRILLQSIFPGTGN
jgi:putative phosphoesterase